MRARGAPVGARLQASEGAAEQALEAPVQAALSLEQRVDAVRNAVWSRNRDTLEAEEDRWTPVDVFDNAVIVRRGIVQIFRVPYTIDSLGEVTFGEPERVEAEYVTITITQETVAASVVQAAEGDAEKEGTEWEVDVMKAGLMPGLRVVQGGRSLPVLVTEQFLASLVPKLEGVPVYALDNTTRGHVSSPSQKRQDQLAGWIDHVRLEGSAVKGMLHFNPAGIGKEKAAVLANAWKKGKRNLFGLSIDSESTGILGRHNNQDVYIAQAATACDSVDVVTRPAAGGGFTRLAASEGERRENLHQEKHMKKREQLLRVIQASRADALRDKDTATIGLAELITIATEEELEEAFGGEKPAQTQTQASEGAGAGDGVQEVRILASEMRVGTMLQASRLPEKVQARLKTQMAGQVLTEVEIQASIDAERAYLADLVPAVVTGLGDGRSDMGVSLGAEPKDKLQAALDRAFGLEPEDSSLKTIAPVGLRQLYDIVTCGKDADVSGQLQASAQQAMLQASFDSTTLASLLSASINRRVVADYRELDYGEKNLISTTGSAKDFKTQETYRWGYFGDLQDIVDEDPTTYPELAQYGEEKATYAVGTKGGMITVTRKHIINDDLGHFVKISGRIGRSARRTHAKFIIGFMINNPVITLSPGTLTWFHATRNNLLSLAFGIAGLDAVKAALFNQLEPGSNERLGLQPYTLWVPQELEKSAHIINESGQDPASANNAVNWWRGKFGPNGERIFTCPFMTDPTDYAVFANPADAELIEVKYLNGRQEPEIIIQDMPTVGSVFTGDQIRFKARHEYGAAPVDYRGGVKSVVPDV